MNESTVKKFEVVLWIVNPDTGCGLPKVVSTYDLHKAYKMLCGYDVEDGSISVCGTDELVAGKEKGRGFIEWFNGWTINGKKVEE